MQSDNAEWNPDGVEVTIMDQDVLGYALKVCVEALAGLPAVVKGGRVMKALGAATVVLDEPPVPHAVVSGQMMEEEEEYMDEDSDEEDEDDEEVEEEDEEFLQDSPPHTPSPIQRLSPELLFHIFSHLPLASLPNVALVNKIWSAAANKYLWDHPKIHYTGSLKGLVTFYANLCGVEGRHRVSKFSLFWSADTAFRNLHGTYGRVLKGIFGMMDGLQAVHLSHGAVPLEALEVLGEKCPQLSVVDLVDMRGLTVEGIIALTQAGKLERLNLSQSRVLPTFWSENLTELAEALATCTRLRTLCIPWLSIPDHSLHILFSAVILLEHLDLSSTLITDTTVASILTSCPRLATIILDSCPQITDETLCHLAQSNVKNASLSRASITDSGILAFARGRGAEVDKLCVCGAKDLTDFSMQILGKHCTQIRLLDIANCRNITHRGLLSFIEPEHGRKNIWMRHLNLTGTSGMITNETIASVLGACPNLVTVLTPMHVRGKVVKEIERRCGEGGGNHEIFFPQQWFGVMHGNVSVSR
ncbi:uncharacterized protein SPPG_04670 [Spizellomyces punctatus DAOM BR117]|uniref:F-box domain-containing protein n=1 Tax=Spizellomyces punctatus (strain DAOM BR117) TaxID=645134 RepID=A0A0L0HGZ4_SPIPD|nr:uncharacterized protein SPPG_04670 [Spizellomyces punctatus DAOM BR117]KND00347.1 hypothetical protein SPPG_04670 [Spizellomyces punctatus DAOM BR117]|eukprot:XP_016608386.1 hypothetical protein SPPG_04670 [Spizellomyces punctatus DAOM BR117]